MAASPIEDLLLEAILESVPYGCDLYFEGSNYGECEWPRCWLNMYREVKIGPYRADFVMGVGGFELLRLVIECDGHDYHERTKEQAAHDRKRDRYMIRHGYLTVRFTGSEIHQDAMACAADVFQSIKIVRFMREDRLRLGREALDLGAQQPEATGLYEGGKSSFGVSGPEHASEEHW